MANSRPTHLEPAAQADAADLTNIVDRLCGGSATQGRQRTNGGAHDILPSRDQLAEVVIALQSIFFPGYFGHSELTHDSVRFHVGAKLTWVRHSMLEQVRRGLCFGRRRSDDHLAARDHSDSRVVVDAWLDRLPEVQRLLMTDVQAAYLRDPAAQSPDEAIFCYPGILACISHRIAHELYKLEVPLLPRIITEHAHSITGIDIHPGATIGQGLFIDHGTGVVVGETTIIGTNVSIYQGVTLGAKSFPLDEDGNPLKGVPRHPIVEDDVVIYSGATILGRVTIGKGSVIGGNVWLTRSLPPKSKITQAKTSQEVYAGGAGI